MLDVRFVGEVSPPARPSTIKAGEIYNFVKMAFLARKITKLQNFAENYKEIG
jgi:hypothetical protein